MPNTELLIKTLEHIKEVPEGWDQSNWRSVPGLRRGKPQPLSTMCGTAMCFAGEAIHLTDPDQWLISVQDLMDNASRLQNMEYWSLEIGLSYVKSERDKFTAVSYLNPLTNKLVWVEAASERAQDLLGITSRDADILFNANNTLEQIENYVGELIRVGNLDRFENDDDDGYGDDDD